MRTGPANVPIAFARNLSGERVITACQWCGANGWEGHDGSTVCPSCEKIAEWSGCEAHGRWIENLASVQNKRLETQGPTGRCHVCGRPSAVTCGLCGNHSCGKHVLLYALGAEVHHVDDEDDDEDEDENEEAISEILVCTECHGEIDGEVPCSPSHWKFEDAQRKMMRDVLSRELRGELDVTVTNESDFSGCVTCGAVDHGHTDECSLCGKYTCDNHYAYLNMRRMESRWHDKGGASASLLTCLRCKDAILTLDETVQKGTLERMFFPLSRGDIDGFAALP